MLSHRIAKRTTMTKTFGRWVLGLTLAAGGVGVSVPMLVHADEPVPQQLATVDQLKAEAFKALKAGQFDRTSELLTKASAGANDPQLTKMAEWTKAFEDQRLTFVAERHKQFEKGGGGVKGLLKNKKDEYTLDYPARAYLPADAKKAFRNEKGIEG